MISKRSTLAASLVLPGLLLLSLSPTAHGATDTELRELRNTILNLVDELVAQGVISRDKADDMKRQAALRAREQSAQDALAEGRAAEAAPDAAGTNVVRVPYVPQFVQDDIKAQVREELRAEVTNDVVAVAKAERWGTPDALPDWVSNLEITGDMRLRALGIYQDSGNNPTIPDFQAINEAGGPAAAGENVFLNTTEDVTRGQARLRLGLAATVADSVKVVSRLTTGNDIDPTTRNQRLGTYNRPFDVFLDLAYLEWRGGSSQDEQTIGLRGGRLPNPFYSTNLLFDDDLTFDGFTARYRWNEIAGDHALFANLGAFSLLSEQANLIDGGTDGKYWWGGQVGMDFRFTDDWGLKVLGSYYNFINVEGERNDFNSTSRDWTAPAFIAKGNTVFDIRNDLDPDTQLFALASGFELVNFLTELRYRGFAPAEVALRADYVTNIGFDSADVAARVGTAVGERTDGWQLELEVGDPEIRALWDWQFFLGYKSLERDAVLDSFTDSDFHAGGTDGEGWLAGAYLGLASDFWLRVRWLSADEIDGAPAGFGVPFDPLAIDVLQVDLNARF